MNASELKKKKSVRNYKIEDLLCLSTGQVIKRKLCREGIDIPKDTRKILEPRYITDYGSIDKQSLEQAEVMNFTEEFSVNDANRKIACENDLILKLCPPFNACLIDKATAKQQLLVPSFCAIVTPSKKTEAPIDPKYLLAFFNSKYYKDQILSVATSTVISIGTVKKIVLPLPSLDEQRQIGCEYEASVKKQDIIQEISDLERKKNDAIIEGLT